RMSKGPAPGRSSAARARRTSGDSPVSAMGTAAAAGATDAAPRLCGRREALVCLADVGTAPPCDLRGGAEVREGYRGTISGFRSRVKLDTQYCISTDTTPGQ